MQASQNAYSNSQQKNQVKTTKINQGSKIPRLIPTKKFNVTTTNSSNLGKKKQLEYESKNKYTTVFKEFNLTKSGSKPIVKRKINFGKENTKRPQNYSKKVASDTTENTQSDIGRTGKIKKRTQVPYVHITDLDGGSTGNADEKQIIEFEPSEFCKNLILQNKELSPSHFTRFTETASTPSKLHRPSVYKKIELDANPYEAAMFEINQLKKLSPSRRYTQQYNTKKCTPKKTSFYSRPSVYKQISPFECHFRSHNLNYCSPSSVHLSSRGKKISFDVDRKNKLEDIDIVNVNSFEDKMNDICSKLNLLLVYQTSAKKDIVNAVSSPSVSQFPDVNFNKNCKSSDTKTIDNKCGNSNQKLCSDPAPFFIKSFKPATSKSITHSIKSSRKLFTPRPVSFYSNSRFHDHGSPLLPSRAHTQVSPSICAPICTPLVLRNIARSSEDSLDASPSLAICSSNFNVEIKNCHQKLQLEFQEEENTSLPTIYDDTHTGSHSASELVSLVNMENILTKQKVSDHLADQECELYLTIMYNENCGFHSSRDFCNPVAKVLKEGDEMHFVPIGSKMNLEI